MIPPTPSFSEKLGAALRDCRVLVVEDTEGIRRLIGAVLNQAGLGDVAYAANGVEGLAAALDGNFDLIILDIMMPEMDGLELCRRLRADPRTGHVPVLVQTGLESREQRWAIFQAGATDLISKPIETGELMARTRVHLENQLMMKRMRRHQERLAEELAMARDMQFSLLPRPSLLNEIEARHDLDIEAVFEPSSELGGDHWAIKDLGDGRIAIGVSDFTGHGVRAALNSFRLDMLIRPSRSEDGSPADYLTLLNQRLVGVLPTGQYAAMLYGVIDLRRNLFSYAAAASPHPVVVNDEGAYVLNGRGFPLGVSRHATYEERITRLLPGATLMLFSDALTETPDMRGQCLDYDGIANLIEDSRRIGASKGMLVRVLDRFRVDRPTLVDDLTAIAITRRRTSPLSDDLGDLGR